MMDDARLNDKYEIEKKFHDDWARNIHVDDIQVLESFEASTAVENRAVMRQFGDLKGKRILDLGCGAGEASVYFALKGGDVFSVDLSDEMLKKANELAAAHGVAIQTFAMPAEALRFDDNLFDYIYGSSILHHADLSQTIKEVTRVLKKNGKAVFIEPLSYNPVIAVYRKIAHDVRTPTETAFRLRDFKFAQQFFADVHFEFCWLTTLNIFLYMYFIEWINPVKDRYWKRVIRESSRYKKMFLFFDRCDRILLKMFPFLKYMCWTIVITLTEKRNGFSDV